jgi:hypothetical protein
MEKQARSDHLLLVGTTLRLKGASLTWILNNIDYFVGRSLGNKRVKEAVLSLYAFIGQEKDVWDKVGQVMGNLQALDTLYISRHKVHEDHKDDDQVISIPVCEKLMALILSHVGQKVTVELVKNELWVVEEVQALARAIREHPTITSFVSCYDLPYEAWHPLYSALATLPALKSITLSCNGLRVLREDESSMVDHASLTELLRVPSLHFVRFDRCSFDPWGHAIANSLIEGTGITKVRSSR